MRWLDTALPLIAEFQLSSRIRLRRDERHTARTFRLRLTCLRQRSAQTMEGCVEPQHSKDQAVAFLRRRRNTPIDSTMAEIAKRHKQASLNGDAERTCEQSEHAQPAAELSARETARRPAMMRSSQIAIRGPTPPPTQSRVPACPTHSAARSTPAEATHSRARTRKTLPSR